MAARREEGNQRRADESTCASDENVHGYTSSSPALSSAFLHSDVMMVIEQAFTLMRSRTR